MIKQYRFYRSFGCARLTALRLVYIDRYGVHPRMVAGPYKVAVWNENGRLDAGKVHQTREFKPTAILNHLYFPNWIEGYNER